MVDPSTADTRNPRGGWAVDALVAVVLVVGTLVYLHGWPHDLLPADEGLFLYEAKRIVDGEVIYRDFFDVISPAPLYVLALVYRVFGVSMDSARMSMALLHTLTVLLIYAICRRLAVRPLLAAAAATAYITLSYPALPVSSPHWYGTFFTLLIIRLALERPLGYAWYGVLGVATGMLIFFQHQKGVVLAAGVALLVMFDELMIEGHRPTRRTIVRLLWVAAGAAAIIGPLGVYLIASAGWFPVYDALIAHPLQQYLKYTGISLEWGQYPWLFAYRYVYPDVVRTIFILVPFTVVRLLWYVAWEEWERARYLSTLIILSTAAAGSVLYNPGYTHVAMVIPVCFILAADALERAFATGEQQAPLLSFVGHGAGLLLCVALALQADQTRRTRWLLYPYPHDTVFGRVDYKSQVEIEMVEAVRTQLAQAQSREFFCYHGCASLYLTADAVNPTRFQLLIPGYNRPDQFAEVQDVLERRQVPVVGAIRSMVMNPKATDPLWPYLKERYQLVPYSPKPSALHMVMRRKPEADKTKF